MLRSLVFEYGPAWAFNRVLYASKIKLLNRVPFFERLFEKSVSVRRIDLFASVIDFEGERAFLKELPAEEKERLIADADRAAIGKIKAFSSVNYDYGYPIDWFKNPDSGYVIDSQAKWFAIPDFSPEAGDIKIYWEISRFTHLLLLARASLLTEAERYYRAFSDQIASWVESNRYSFGPNYKCGQEASLRMINVLMAYSVFQHQGFTTPEDEQNILLLVEGSYKKILSNFFYAHRCIKNNHTLSEACGMFIGAWCCNDTSTMKKAVSFYEEAIEYQFRPDGGYTQWSFNYQRFALQISMLFVLLLRSMDHALTDESIKKIINCARLLEQVQDADSGMLPNYGSNDGALVLPLSQSRFRDFSPTIGCALQALEGGSPYLPGLCNEESIWWGLRPSGKFEERKKSAIFPNAGIGSLRNECFAVMLVAPDYEKSRPAHMDSLHIDVWSDGINILCDGGTYSYASKEGHYLCSTRAHNVVQLDGIEQMSFRPPFLMMDWPKRRMFECDSESLVAEMKFSTNYAHRRLVRLCGDEIHIEDSIFGNDAAVREVLFHTQLAVVVRGSCVVLLKERKEYVTMFFAQSGLISIELEDSFVSDKYLEKNSCTCIVAKYEASTRDICTKVSIINA